MSTSSLLVTLSNRTAPATDSSQDKKDLSKEPVKQATRVTDVYNSDANLAQDRKDNTFSPFGNTNALPTKKNNDLEQVIYSSDDEINSNQFTLSRLNSQVANAQMRMDRAQTEMMNATMNEARARSAMESAMTGTKPNDWMISTGQTMMANSQMRSSSAMSMISSAQMSQSTASNMMDSVRNKIQMAVATQQNAEIELIG